MNSARVSGKSFLRFTRTSPVRVLATVLALPGLSVFAATCRIILKFLIWGAALVGRLSRFDLDYPNMGTLDEIPYTCCGSLFPTLSVQRV